MEALFEILFEVFGELIIHIFGYVIGSFFDYLNANSKVKKIVKSCVGFTFFGLILLVLILSLIYQKTALGCFVARQEKDEELEVLKYSLHASAVTGLKG